MTGRKINMSEKCVFRTLYCELQGLTKPGPSEERRRQRALRTSGKKKASVHRLWNAVDQAACLSRSLSCFMKK